MFSKELLEPIRPLAKCLQGRLQEVYFGFKKIREITQHYQTIREEVDIEHDRIHRKALDLSKQVDSEEQMPRIIRGRQSRPNPSVTSPCDYWWVTVTIPFLDSIISEVVSRFADEKRAHFELRVLIPGIIKEKDVQETAGILKSKWKHLLPAEDNLDSELS